MARVTVEDCRKVVENHFELVALAAKRSKEIECGSEVTIENSNKTVVTALREIAAGNIDIENMREKLIASLQSKNKIDNIHEENVHADGTDEVDDIYEMVSENDYVSEAEEKSMEDMDFFSFDDDVIDEKN